MGRSGFPRGKGRGTHRERDTQPPKRGSIPPVLAGGGGGETAPRGWGEALSPKHAVHGSVPSAPWKELGEGKALGRVEMVWRQQKLGIGLKATGLAIKTHPSFALEPVFPPCI